jgi:hypothetical protein
VASDAKDQYTLENYTNNPFFKSLNMVEFYDDARDEQFEDFDMFNNMSQNIVNKNMYDTYKSFFYRYQDYNQINR